MGAPDFSVEIFHNRYWPAGAWTAVTIVGG